MRPSVSWHALPGGRISARGRRALLLLACGLVVALAVARWPDLAVATENVAETPWGIGAILLLYTVLLAIPFVPAAEIGLAVLAVFGATLAIPIYIATVAALSLAYHVGRMASDRHLPRATGAADPAWLDAADRMPACAMRRWLRPLLRVRWLAVLVLINTPGNSVIGGGGGIAMAVGYSRTLTYPAFLACIALAVAPVPAAVMAAEHLGLGIGLDHWWPAAGHGRPDATGQTGS